MLDRDEDGEHAPLLLTTLDLSHWTSIMFVSTQDDGVEKALARLREAHEVLANLLEKNDLDLEEATSNAQLVETALRLANLHEDWSAQPPPTRTDPMSMTHPILGKLNIPQAHHAAIEDYGECIQTTQQDQELATLESSSKGPLIPFLSPRTVEVIPALIAHGV
jgi:hypothetical protein